MDEAKRPPVQHPAFENKEAKKDSVNPQKGREYVPDIGQGAAGSSDRITRAYLDSMLLVYRHLGAVPPSTETRILNRDVSTPIMASALALLERFDPDGSAAFARGIQRAGAVMWTGWIDNEMFRRVADTGANAVCGVKPFQDNDKIYEAIEKAAEAGAVGICMDIDHCFDDTGADCGFVFGQLGHKSLAEIQSYAAAASAHGLPFFLKGILDPADAIVARKLGVAGIVVSHHQGIWCYAAPPAMMLQEIRSAVGSEYPVFADCGVHSGVDVFKYLAAGADAVGVARELMTAFSKKGADGVYDRIMFMNDELKGTMAKTGRATLKEIDMSAIRFRSGW